MANASALRTSADVEEKAAQASAMEPAVAGTPTHVKIARIFSNPNVRDRLASEDVTEVVTSIMAVIDPVTAQRHLTDPATKDANALKIIQKFGGYQILPRSAGTLSSRDMIRFIADRYLELHQAGLFVPGSIEEPAPTSAESARRLAVEGVKMAAFGGGEYVGARVAAKAGLGRLARNALQILGATGATTGAEMVAEPPIMGKDLDLTAERFVEALVTQGTAATIGRGAAGVAAYMLPSTTRGAAGELVTQPSGRIRGLQEKLLPSKPGEQVERAALESFRKHGGVPMATSLRADPGDLGTLGHLVSLAHSMGSGGFLQRAERGLAEESSAEVVQLFARNLEALAPGLAENPTVAGTFIKKVLETGSRAWRQRGTDLYEMIPAEIREQPVPDLVGPIGELVMARKTNPVMDRAIRMATAKEAKGGAMQAVGLAEAKQVRPEAPGAERLQRLADVKQLRALADVERKEAKVQEILNGPGLRKGTIAPGATEPTAAAEAKLKGVGPTRETQAEVTGLAKLQKAYADHTQAVRRLQNLQGRVKEEGLDPGLALQIKEAEELLIARAQRLDALQGEVESATLAQGPLARRLDAARQEHRAALLLLEEAMAEQAQATTTTVTVPTIGDIGRAKSAIRAAQRALPGKSPQARRAQGEWGALETIWQTLDDALKGRGRFEERGPLLAPEAIDSLDKASHVWRVFKQEVETPDMLTLLGVLEKQPSAWREIVTNETAYPVEFLQHMRVTVGAAHWEGKLRPSLEGGFLLAHAKPQPFSTAAAVELDPHAALKAFTEMPPERAELLFGGKAGRADMTEWLSRWDVMNRTPPQSSMGRMLRWFQLGTGAHAIAIAGGAQSGAAALAVEAPVMLILPPAVAIWASRPSVRRALLGLTEHRAGSPQFWRAVQAIAAPMGYTASDLVLDSNTQYMPEDAEPKPGPAGELAAAREQAQTIADGLAQQRGAAPATSAWTNPALLERHAPGSPTPQPGGAP